MPVTKEDVFSHLRAGGTVTWCVDAQCFEHVLFSDLYGDNELFIRRRYAREPEWSTWELVPTGFKNVNINYSTVILVGKQMSKKDLVTPEHRAYINKIRTAGNSHALLSDILAILDTYLPAPIPWYEELAQSLERKGGTFTGPFMAKTIREAAKKAQENNEF